MIDADKYKARKIARDYVADYGLIMNTGYLLNESAPPLTSRKKSAPVIKSQRKSAYYSTYRMCAQ